MTGHRQVAFVKEYKSTLDQIRCIDCLHAGIQKHTVRFVNYMLVSHEVLYKSILNFVMLVT